MATLDVNHAHYTCILFGAPGGAGLGWPRLSTVLALSEGADGLRLCIWRIEAAVVELSR